jgi:glycosyltransferase involved in cell wall biosynthesis
MKSIAVIIPAYRVEEHLIGVIQSIPASVDFIIVVNDNSPDNTLEKALSLDDPRLHVLTHTQNEGVGGAMLTGYSYALKLGVDIAVKVDGDGQMDLQYLPALLEPLEYGYADYTKGNRFLHSSELKNMPFIRLIGNIALSFLTKLASGYWNIFDPTNGYTAITCETMSQIRPSNIKKDYFYETSLLCELRALDAVIEDVPIPALYADEKSSMNVIKETFNFSANLIQRAFRRFFFQYFLFNFSAVSAYIVSGFILGIFGIIWGAIFWHRSSITGIPATTGTVLIAVLAIILSAQLLIQAVALDVESSPRRTYLKGYSASPRIPGSHPLLGYFDQHLKAGTVSITREGKFKGTGASASSGSFKAADALR